jgi:hypothetical protein
VKVERRYFCRHGHQASAEGERCKVVGCGEITEPESTVHSIARAAWGPISFLCGLGVGILSFLVLNQVAVAIDGGENPLGAAVIAFFPAGFAGFFLYAQGLDALDNMRRRRRARS